MNLYAICWQDLSEPWGWEPLTNLDGFEFAGGLLPDGPFFWGQGEAESALASIRAAAVEREIERLRTRDRDRHAREQAAYAQDVARGHPLPGVTVHVAGQPERPFAPEPPRPLSTDARLRQEAEKIAGREFSVQVYEVPDPRSRPMPTGEDMSLPPGCLPTCDWRGGPIHAPGCPNA